MKESLIALAITLAVALTIVSGIRIGQDWHDLNERAAHLEAQLAHHQTMLDDAHRYVDHLRRELICVDSDMTAREWLWIMADQFAEAGVQVKFH